MRKNKPMKQWYLTIAVALGMAFMTACSSDEPGPVDNTYEGVELTPAESVICDGMGDFNIELFKTLVSRENKANSEDNLIVSPLSASVFLSMHANFSSERIQKQIFNVLGTSDLEALNNFNAKILANLDNWTRRRH